VVNYPRDEIATWLQCHFSEHLLMMKECLSMYDPISTEPNFPSHNHHKL
jgi:uncharacterized protein (UPF0147 family)